MMCAVPARLPKRPAGVGVILVRHAQSELNAQGRFCGRTDPGLSALGLDQARALAHELRQVRLSAIYASTQRRAIESARQLGDPICVQDLHEIDQGELEGMRFADAMRAYPDFFAAWKADPSSVTIPGGEALHAARDRARLRLKGLVAQHTQGEWILVVGHQLTFASLLADIDGAPSSDYNNYAMANAGWTALLASAGGFEILARQR